MPKYKKKQTSDMTYDEFKEKVSEIPESPRYSRQMRQALLTLLFFAGCRISEALALTSDDIICKGNTIYVHFFRLKNSKQTDDQQLPKVDAMNWICEQEGKLFPLSRTTAWRIVSGIWPNHYPHFFRQNRIVWISERFGDNTVYSTIGICAQSIDHYRAKIGIKKVGKAMWEEITE